MKIKKIGDLLKFKWTGLALAVGLIVWLAAMIGHLDIFESIIEALESAEHLELDELILISILVLIGLTADAVSMNLARRRQLDVEKQRLTVLKATARSVQDIVGNCLNQFQFLVRQAEKSEELKPESLKRMEAMIIETSEKLKELGDLETTPERIIGREFPIIDMKKAQAKSPR